MASSGRLRQICSGCQERNCIYLDESCGMYFCNNCGAQAEEAIESGVDAENFTTYSQSTRRRTAPTAVDEDDVPDSPYHNYNDVLHSPPPSKLNFDYPSQPTQPMDFGSGQLSFTREDYSVSIRERYLSGIQVMIQLQCQALVRKFSVSPLIVGLFGPIWLRFLASTGLTADNWADYTALFSESQSQAGQDDEFDPNASCRGEPVNMFNKRLVMIWFRSLSSKIHVSCSLAITFLVCHVAREPVLPTDIVKWACEGKLPYLAAFSEVDKHLGHRSRACPINAAIMFKPSQVISTQQLEAMAAEIARIIGLDLPPVNFYAIALRYCRQLCLPTEKILPKACQIFEWFLLPELHLSASKFRIPTRAYVMAILIVAIRILFDINGYGFWESSLSDIISSPQREENGDKEPQCQKTVSADGVSPLEDSEPHGTASEVPDSELNAAKLLQILEAKYVEFDDPYDYSRDLSSYLQYCKDVVFSGSQPSYEEQDEQELLEELWDFYQHNKATELESSGLNDNRSRKANGESSCAEESCKDRAIRQMKLQMEENKFCYISPRSNIKRRDYLHYRRRKKDVYIYAVHADYYILLRSCAKVAQVEARIMHVAVLSFEKRLEWLEKQMDSSLSVKPNQINFCDFCRD